MTGTKKTDDVQLTRQGEYKEKQWQTSLRDYMMSHPHGDADGTVHVAFIQPAMFGNPSFLGS